MPHINIKIEWFGRKPNGAPNETTTVWPRALDTDEEASNFRAAVCEYLDDEFGEQPKSITWKGAVAPVLRGVSEKV